MKITDSILIIISNYLRQHNIKMIRAPFEADPQLAYLYHKGIINAIITEDSDLLVYVFFE